MVLSLLGAALALRESSIPFDLELADGRLLLKSYNVVADFGPVPGDQNLTLLNTAQGEKRSPVYLIRESGALSDVWRFLASYSKPQGPLVVSGSQLQRGRVSLRFWNPSDPVLAVYLGTATPLGSVRFRVPDKSLEVHTQQQNGLVPWFAPLLTLLIAGLSFALLSGCALLFFISLLWSLTTRIAAGATQLTTPSSQLLYSAGRTSRARRVLSDYQWALVFVLGAVWIGYVRFIVFQNQYGFGDEMNYLIQARILASGHLSLLQPTNADFFKVAWMDLMVGDGKIWNFHPIGNSLLLGIGVLLGSPAIIPPLVGGGIFATLFALGRRLVGNSAFAWLSVLVAASSQYVATVSGSFMAHAPALLFIELATLSLVIFWQTGSERYVVLTGAFLGAAFIIRPLSAVLISVVPAVFLCVALLQKRVRFRTLVLAAVVGLGIASLECWRTYLTAGQFTLAYLAKGPEANMTFAARWARGWDFRLKNLFVNYRYYHTRVFGLGFAGNLVFFFIPLVAASRLWWVWLSYVAIAIYWVVQSFLHFYGWMWEPRMLFEFTHLTVLLTAYGMWLLITYRGSGPGRISPIAAAAAVAAAGTFLGFNFFYDLPERFRTEYHHYNKTDPYVRDQIRQQGIRNAIFFYQDATNGFAPHSGDNAITVGKSGEAVFEGNVIHAIHLGSLTDYALISRYPNRRVFLVKGPEDMQEQPNFYRDALPKLAAALSPYQGTHAVAVGIPWMEFADPQALSAYGWIKFFDDQGFFSTFVDGTLPNRPFVIALVGGMKNYTEALHEMYAKVEPIAADDLGYPVSIVAVDPASKRANNGSLGLQMNVHAAAKGFKAPPFSPMQCLNVPAESRRVGLVHFDARNQVSVCVEWSGEFSLDAPATYTFALASDDGAGIVIDGKTVIDNGMFKSGAGSRQEGTVQLDPGRHTFYLSYVQITGPALLEVEVKKDAEPFVPLSMTALGVVMHVRSPDEVVNRYSLMGLDSVVVGRSVPVDNIDDVTPGEPIVEIVDPGPDQGSLQLQLPKPYSVKDYPYVQFYYEMAPDTAYSMMVRLVGESEFIELPMRIEHPRREGKLVGAFNAEQDNRWHLMKFNLYEALGARDVSIEEAVMGEWAGAAERRTLYFKDVCVGPHKVQITARNPDNEVRLVPSPVSVVRRDGPTLDAQNAPGACPLPVSAPAAAPAPGAAAQLIDNSLLRVSSFRQDAPELAGNAVDGSAATRWDTGAPQAGGEWFRINLTRPVRLASILLDTAGSPQDYPRHLDVLVSADGDNFQQVAALDGHGSPTRVDLETPVQVCSIRLQQKGRDGYYFWSIYELHLWGVPLPGDCATAQPTAAPTRPPAPIAAPAAAVAPGMPAVDRGQFPKLQLRWWRRISNPIAWLALAAMVLTGWGTLVARRRTAARPAPAAAARPDASPPVRRWRMAGILTAVVFGVILIGTQNDYGETWDEWEHFGNGEQYYQYLFGDGKTPELYGHEFRQYYGPFSDVVATVIKHVVCGQLGLMSESSALHLHLNLLFVAGGLILFFVVLPEYGGRAAYLCLLVYCASPHLLGHCHNNMKDFAVTGWTVAAVFAFYAGVRRRSYPGMALAGLVTGMSLATKINGAALGPLFLVFVVLFVVVDTQPGESVASRIRFAALGCGVVYGTMALAAMILLWPWLWAAPYKRFWETVHFFQHHIWNGVVLYKGRMIPASQIPREYAPYYVLVTTPIAWLPFAVAGLVRAGVELCRRRLLFVLVGLAFLAPVAVEVFTSVPIYDGVRHFLPAFPFLACLVGFGMDWLLTVVQQTRLSRGVAWLVVGVAIGSATVQDIRIHPYQSTYFNTVVGGGRGAMGQFELDYWGNSLKEAGRWVNEHAPPKSKVDVILGLHRLARLRPDLLATDSNPDYAIVLNRESLAPDPYKGRTPIYSVTADGAVLARVYCLTPP